MIRRIYALAALGAAALAFSVASCSAPSPPTPAEAPPAPEGWFRDVTAESGLAFVHDAGATGTFFMPQSMGSGAAVFDLDGDGLLDIYLLNFGGPDSASVNRLFQQIEPGKFRDVTDGSGAGLPGWNHGVAAGDVNNDGRPDLIITQFGGIKLLINLGGGKFRDATAEAGLSNPAWGMSAALLDFDRDGWLDLVVINYLDYDRKVECLTPLGARDFCGPASFQGVGSKVYRNTRDPAGRFEDVSSGSGIGAVRGPGLGVSAADFDGDGWPDIFVANDGQPNRLWINQKNGTFADQAVSRGIAFTAAGKAFAGMGVAVGDVNNDGLLDVFVTHLGTEMNNLWRQEPRGQFSDRTAESGLSVPRWRATGFGALMADFNHDGGLDIAV
ncbi:MAG TPA: VCBS repeat-containing protein, partial [Gemmata sp.]